MSENETGNASAESDGFDVDPLNDFDELVNEIEESEETSEVCENESDNDPDPFQTTF